MRVGSFNKRVHQCTLLTWAGLSAFVGAGSWLMLAKVSPDHHLKLYGLMVLTPIVFCVSVYYFIQSLIVRRKMTAPPNTQYYAPSEERALPIRPPLHRFKR